MLVPDRGLRIPEWADHIAAKARELHQAHSHSAIAVAVIERLATDPRMQRVWDEFAKRKRSRDKKQRRTEQPLYRVAERFASAGIDERTAAAGLFEFAVTMGRATLMLPSADAPERPWEGTAKAVRDVAKQLGGDHISQIIARRLRREADAYERITVTAYNPPKAIALEIAGWLENVFGSPMYGITAISVITERESLSAKSAPGLRRAHTLPKNN
jgi:hypothetical protein